MVNLFPFFERETEREFSSHTIKTALLKLFNLILNILDTFLTPGAKGLSLQSLKVETNISETTIEAYVSAATWGSYSAAS